MLGCWQAVPGLWSTMQSVQFDCGTIVLVSAQDHSLFFCMQSSFPGRARMKTLTILWHIRLIVLLALLPVSGSLDNRATPAAQLRGLAAEKSMLSSSPAEANSEATLSYPADPSADTAWSAGTASVADIQAAFNNARTIENSQLGTTIPMMILPEQPSWNSMSNGEKALWLINRERIDRGVEPLQGLENNVSDVAQAYADYLLDNNAWGHVADGRDPWQRLSDKQAIGACHDFLPIAENLAVFVTSGSSIPMPIERSIYMWMYDDGDCCGWGHRHAVLWYPYNDNSGSSGREGFLGMGRASGGHYQGGFSQPWPFAEVIVMNVFDPCSNWTDLFAPGAATLTSPSSVIAETTPTFSWNTPPDTGTTDPATWYYLWLDGPSGTIFQQWYTSAQAHCNGSTCSVTPTRTLAGGSYTWWIQTWNETGYGPWSSGATFTVSGAAPPGKASLVSPDGNNASTNPDYTWNEVNGATWYYLWVNGPSGNVIKQWYTSQQANCDGSTCSIASPKALAAGGHAWWIQTWSAAGYGPWSDGKTFNVSTPVPPEKASLIAPNGSGTSPTPTYRWNQVPGSTWYYLWVNDASGTPIIQQWYTSGQANCDGSICSVTSGPALNSGSYRWWIQTWNNAGYGLWSNGLGFMISP